MITMTSNEKTFNAWITYQAINAHFTRDYDYFRYNGKLNMTYDSMERQFNKYEHNSNFSAQRQIFDNLGKSFKHKEDLIFFYLSQFTNGITYPSMFDSDLYEFLEAVIIVPGIIQAGLCTIMPRSMSL